MAPWRSRRRATRYKAFVGVSIAVSLAAVGCADADTAPDLRFARHGVPVAAKTTSELESVADPRSIRVFDPYEEREIEFEAFPLDVVLDAVFSPSWREEEEILFTCSDGYQPTLPVPRVLEHDAWLAFDRIDRDGFAIEKIESGSQRRIELAPFYLVWENLDDEQMRREGDYGWPYQLIGIELIRASERFPAMVPPDDASPDAVAGFQAFRAQCSRCHAINGEGGTIGPDLNFPVNPVDVREVEWIRHWIDDPSAMLPTARMPRLNPELPEREQTIDRLIEYLRAMARSRPPNANEVRPDGI